MSRSRSASADRLGAASRARSVGATAGRKKRLLLEAVPEPGGPANTSAFAPRGAGSALVALLLAAFGCASVEQVYPGPARDPSEIARIASDEGKLVAVDGRSVFATEIHVLPGRHAVVAEFRVEGRDYGKHVRDEYVGKLLCALEFEASAGFEYEVGLNPLIGGDRRGSRDRFYHSAYVRRLPNTLPEAKAPCRWKR